MIGAGSLDRPAEDARLARIRLAKRIFWAVVLGTIAVSLCVWGVWPFAALVIVGAIIVLWEWAQLVGDGVKSRGVWIQTGAIAAAVIAMTAGYYVAAFLCLLVAVIGSFVIAKPSERRGWLIAGVAYAGLPALAMVWLRSDPVWGATAILFVFAIVWTADSAAYITGRLIGGPKLNPRLSPRKTWSGLIGGSIAPLATAAVFATFVEGASMAPLVLLGLVISLAAHAGDLGESAVKRRFGVKDTSQLIPGHGGMIDRIDGLLVAILTATTIALVRWPLPPGEALLLWQ